MSDHVDTYYLGKAAARGRPVLWTLSLGVLAAIGWSCIAEIDIVVTARGRVISEGQAKTIQAPAAGAVKVIYAKEGFQVRKGDVLLEMDTTVSSADVDNLKEKISQLRAEFSRIEAEYSGKAPAYLVDGSSQQAARVDTQEALRASRVLLLSQRKYELQAVIQGRNAALQAGEAAIKGLETRLSIAKEKEARARPYVDLAVSRFQYLQLRDDAAQAEKELVAQEGSNKRLQQEIREAQQKLAQIDAERRNTLASEFAEKRSLLVQSEKELEKASKRESDLFVRSPQDGIVQKVMVTTSGATVGAGERLFQLVPSGTPVVIEILVPNEDRGAIRQGQVVSIKLDAFPYQKFGRLTGHLKWLSPDAELSEVADVTLLTQGAQLRRAGTSFPQYVFRGTVTPEQGSNSSLKLDLGLTAQVDIVTGRRRLIDFFLFPVRRAVEDGFGVS